MLLAGALLGQLVLLHQRTASHSACACEQTRPVAGHGTQRTRRRSPGHLRPVPNGIEWPLRVILQPTVSGYRKHACDPFIHLQPSPYGTTGRPRARGRGVCNPCRYAAVMCTLQGLGVHGE